MKHVRKIVALLFAIALCFGMLPGAALAADMFAGCSGIRLSAVETNGYATPYRVPMGADAEYAAENALENMFAGTGGTFSGTPELETVYYLHDSNSIAW